MNKLFTKIGVTMVGIAMAVGVGVATSRNTKVEKAEAAGGTFTKITSTSDLASGYKYLIVYETGNLAFDGSRTTFDAVGNSQSVTITSNTITTNSDFYFVISSMNGGYSVQGSSGKYINQTSYANGLATSDSAAANLISFDASGNVVIQPVASKDGNNNSYTSLRYNDASNQTRFRFYKTGQKAVQLYKGPAVGIEAQINGESTMDSGATWTATSITEKVGGATVSDATYAFEAKGSVVLSNENTSTGSFKATGYGCVIVSATKTSYKIESLVVKVSDKISSAENPYTVAEARYAIDANEHLTNAYVKGIVTELVSTYNPSYGNISFNFSDDGESTSNQFQAYRCMSYDSAKYDSNDDIKVGDLVVVYGNLKKYSSTYELGEGCKLISNAECEKEISDFADLFLGEMRDDDVCGTDEAGWNNDHKTAVSALWETFADLFADLRGTSKALFVETSSDEDVVAAVKLYNHCVARYDLGTWTGVPASSAPVTLSNASSNNSGLTAIIIIAAALTTLTVGGIFLLKKKEEK